MAYARQSSSSSIRSWSLAVGLLAALGLAPNGHAGVIHPGLEEQLASLAPSAPVSAILILVDQGSIASLSADLSARGATRQARHREVVLSLQNTASRSQRAIRERLDALRDAGRVEGYTTHWIANLIVVRGQKSAIQELAARADVAQAEVDFKPELVPPVDLASNPPSAQRGGIGVTPGQRAIGADRCWYELGVNGAGALVGNLDTGVSGSHPALSARWRGNHRPWQECWKDVLGTGTQFPTDTNSHGTHVMGTLTGLGAATEDTIGTAWGAEWIAANAINQSVGSEFDNDVIASFEWFADPDGNPNTVDDVADVVENSWRINEQFGHGYTDCDSRWGVVIDNVEAAGTVLIFAAGNEGPGARTVGSPADRTTTPLNAFSVGAVDATQFGFPYPIASFSSRGPSGCAGNAIKPEICAPGVEVYSSVPGGGYQQTNWNGTSMAGPHVAGVVALLRSVDPNLEVDVIKQILLDTAIDEGSAGEDNDYGWGFVNAYDAVLGVASTMGSIDGVVTNTSDGGIPLPGATVRVVEPARAYTSGVDGSYSGFSPPGTFTVEASHPSCQTETVTDVVIEIGGNINLDFAMTDIVAPAISDVFYPPYQEATLPVSAKVGDLSTITRVDLIYRVSGGGWQSLPMMSALSEIGNYETEIPGQAVGALLEFYVEAEDVAGNIGTEPAGAPGDLFSWIVEQAFFVDNVETDRGWSLSQPGDATAGTWVRADPLGTLWNGQQAEPANDHTVDPGTLCYVTGLGTVGGQPQASDVDNGCVTLTSPIIDLSDAMSAQVSYWRWYGQFGGAGAGFTVSVSRNGGASWSVVETLSTNANLWSEKRFDLSLGALTGQMQFRFVACDPLPETLVEAAIDDFAVSGLPNGTTSAEPPEPALRTEVLPNLPNPFTGGTAIRFRLAQDEDVRIGIYDTNGRLVRSLLEGRVEAGTHANEWDGTNSQGRRVPAGIYLYRVEAGSYRAERKMMRLD